MLTIVLKSMCLYVMTVTNHIRGGMYEVTQISIFSWSLSVFVSFIHLGIVAPSIPDLQYSTEASNSFQLAHANNYIDAPLPGAGNYGQFPVNPSNRWTPLEL
jgi:hypothetical protein